MKKFNLFIDESGDHGLANINEEFPVFVLCGLLIDETEYAIFNQAVDEIKIQFWNNKNVIFHSRDIRKCEKEFVLLFNLEKKEDFYNKINFIFTTQKIILIASAIDKNKYVIKHGKLEDDIYEVSLSFVIDKCINILINSFDEQFELNIFIEKRGRKEDQKLSEHFQRLKSRGTGDLKPEVFNKHIINIEFKSKKENINGIQFADLAAYHIARYTLDKQRVNPSFEILKPKLYQKDCVLEGIMEYP
jgi:hypothetical protein